MCCISSPPFCVRILGQECEESKAPSLMQCTLMGHNKGAHEEETVAMHDRPSLSFTRSFLIEPGFTQALRLTSAGNSSLTISRVLTFMLPSSCNSNLNAYGSVILTTLLPVSPAFAHR